MANVNLGVNALNQPEGVHVGLNVALLKISASFSLSGGDVILIGKIPHGAIPVDSIFYPNPSVTGIGTFVAKFGTSASQEMFFISATYSTNVRCSRRLGFNQQVSLSDDMGLRVENIVMVTTAGASLGYIGDLVIFYKMPGQSPG